MPTSIAEQKKWLAASFVLAGPRCSRAVSGLPPVFAGSRRISSGSSDTNARSKRGQATMDVGSGRETAASGPEPAAAMVVAYRARVLGDSFDTGEPFWPPRRGWPTRLSVWFYPCKTLAHRSDHRLSPGRSRRRSPCRAEIRPVRGGRGRGLRPRLASMSGGLPAFAAAWAAYLILLAPNSGLVRAQ